MTCTDGELERRAVRLLRWYPRAWRLRYGDEFVALLVAELAERPHSLRRNLDLARCGALVRLTVCGLAGPIGEPGEQSQRSLATLGAAAAVFGVCGIALWAQLAIGWQWAPPAQATTALAMVIMSYAAPAAFVAALSGLLPIAWTTARRLCAGAGWAIGGPSVAFLVGVAVLVFGARHFGNGWPGTGGHPWAHRGIVPGGLAAFSWAATLWLSAYWAHPGALMTFPIAEVMWMVVSPLAAGCAAFGAATTIRRLDLGPRLRRFELCVGALLLLAMFTFLVGASTWVLNGGSGPRNLFRAGAIDGIELALMAVALIVGLRAVVRASRSAAAVVPG